MFVSALSESGLPGWADRIQRTPPEDLVTRLTDLEKVALLPTTVWAVVVRYKAFLQGRLDIEQAKRAIWELAGLI